MGEQQQRVEGVMSNNTDFVNATALQIRLDTDSLLQQIEFFLRGLEPNKYWQKETQTWQIKLDEMGVCKANKKGVQALLNFCRALINPQVVQGNYDLERYLDFIVEKRVEVARMCFVNFYDWELKSADAIAEITNFIMNIVEPFLSRTIDNEERKSYDRSLKENSVHTVLGKQGGLGFIGGDR